MINKNFSFMLSSLLPVVASSSSVAANSAGKPNIILIMADDLGYSDLSCYGSEIQTPNIDSIAENGMKFTQVYNSARSCPSRASLLTGLYPHKAGLGHMVKDRGFAGYRGHITKNTVTIAEVLKQNGYKTYMTGKWHLTNKWQDETDKSTWPVSRGFDKYYGFLVGHTSLWHPKYLVEGNSYISLTSEQRKNYFFTDKMTDYSVDYIKEAAGSEKPFFMYVAYPNPHYPLHARQKTIAKYNGVYDKGWDEIRQERFKRLKKLGIISEETRLSPRDEMVPPWKDEPWKEWQAHRMQVFAAMVDEMDQGVGRILKTLKETGAYDNTMVVFLADNGGSPEGHLFNTVERLHIPWKTKMFDKNLPDGRTVNPGDWPDEPLGGPTTYGSYGPKWANVSNTPFRMFKTWNHEGGICTPMVIQWPARLKRVNSISHEICHVIDFMPTALEMANVDYPSTYNGNAIHPIEGRSLLPALSGGKVRSDADVLGWEHEGNRAIRQGKWKMTFDYKGSYQGVRDYSDENRWKLYDLSKDRTELNDLSKKYPEKVKQMHQLWLDWCSRNNVKDWHQTFVNQNMQKTD